jgi:hypothetical protein
MGFAGFADVFSTGIRGSVAWVRQLIETINELQAPIQAIGVELGRAFGQYFIDLFRWSVEELANNYDAYVDLVDIMAHLIGILFSVSKFAALVASTFEPVLAVVEALAAVLQNKLVIAIFAFLAPLALVVGLLASLSYIITTIGFGAIIAGISGAAVAVWNLVAALATANALTAGLTLGLSLIGVGAGLLAVKEILDDHDGIGGNGQPGLSGGSTIPAPGSGTGRGGGGGGDTFNLNIYGSPDRHSTNRLISAIDSRIDRKTTISRNTARSP